jgi:hypothetical protein
VGERLPQSTVTGTTKTKTNKSMKRTNLVALSLTAALTLVSAQTVMAQSLDTLPPVVVKTVPEAGSTNVPPGVLELRVTFSKEMADHSWSWSDAWQGATPEVLAPPRYEPDRKTCVIKVRLAPDRTYGYWLNSQKFTGFRDPEGRVAVPYLLAFKTRSQ